MNQARFRGVVRKRDVEGRARFENHGAPSARTKEAEDFGGLPADLDASFDDRQ